MARIFHRNRSCPQCIAGRARLALVWILGLFSGLAAGIMSETISFPLMRSTVFSAVSIVGLFHTLLPFLLSAVAMVLHAPGMLLPLCFGKAFLSSYASFAICRAFGTAGWLVRWFLMFTDLWTLPILYYFWLRILSGTGAASRCEALFLSSLALLLGSIDYAIISPLFLELVTL